MREIRYNEDVYEVDEDGFLLDPRRWNEGWARYVAEIEGIPELTEEYHRTIRNLREYHQEYGVFPMVRLFYKCTGLTQVRAYQLFPSGPGKGACKMAGLPRPFYLSRE